VLQVLQVHSTLTIKRALDVPANFSTHQN
jgi:hypothetical protein